MTLIEYAIELAGLDPESVKTAGRVKVLFLPEQPSPQWYHPWMDVRHFSPPMLFIDIWAVKPQDDVRLPHGERAEFVLRRKDGTVVADSAAEHALHPQMADFFMFPVVLTPRQYQTGKALQESEPQYQTGKALQESEPNTAPPPG